MSDTDREALEELLRTVKPLATSGVLRQASGDRPPAVASQLAQRWSTKQRLIERLLTETDPRTALDRFETRTQDFIERNPETPGWHDKAGHEWNAERVIQAIEEIRDHLDSWDAIDPVNDDDTDLDDSSASD